MAARAVGGADSKAAMLQVKDKELSQAKKAADAAQVVFQGPDKRALADALASSRLPEVIVTDADAGQTSEFRRVKTEQLEQQSDRSKSLPRERLKKAARESDAPAGAIDSLQLDRKDSAKSSAELQLPPINISERAPVDTSGVQIDLRDSQSSALPELPLDVPPRKDRRSRSLGQCVLCRPLKGSYEPLPPLPALPPGEIKSRSDSALGHFPKAIKTPRSPRSTDERDRGPALVVIGFGMRKSDDVSGGTSSIFRDSWRI